MWKDSETVNDYLNYEYLVGSVEDIVENDDLLPASIGIYGDWGSGKSSLMQMCKEKLETDDKEIKCIYFNGWLFENYEDAKTALLSSIIDEINEDERFRDKVGEIILGLNKSIDKFKLAQFALKSGLDLAISGGVGTLASLTLGGFARIASDKIASVSDEQLKTVKSNVQDSLDKKELREDIRKFQSKFDELIEKSKMSRLVIFIDELDRCRPDTILDTLEAMKLFMFTGKVAFIIGADERHITYAVKNKFSDIEGIQIDIGKEYLEKLIQYPIRIPRMDIYETETYIASLLLEDVFNEKQKLLEIWTNVAMENKQQYMASNIPYLLRNKQIQENEDAKSAVIVAGQISGILSAGLHGNPRQVKRFLNTMDLRIRQAKCKSVELDRAVLLKLMLLEYISPQRFRKYAELNSDNKLGDEIEKLETSGAEVEKENSESDWFNKWIKIEPRLSDMDLSSYFYFSRTSLDEKISRISTILSPTGQQILDSIIKETELALESALSIDISDVEKANIIEAFALRIGSMQRISNKQVEYFVRFVNKCGNMYDEAFECIKQFSYKQLELGAIVPLANLSVNAGKVEDMKKIVEKWDQDNGKAKFMKAFEGAVRSK